MFHVYALNHTTLTDTLLFSSKSADRAAEFARLAKLATAEFPSVFSDIALVRNGSTWFVDTAGQFVWQNWPTKA